MLGLRVEANLMLNEGMFMRAPCNCFWYFEAIVNNSESATFALRPVEGMLSKLSVTGGSWDTCGRRLA